MTLSPRGRYPRGGGLKALDGNNGGSALCTPLLAVWVVGSRHREHVGIVSKEPCN